MKKAVSRIYVGLCFAFLYVPILILIIFSFLPLDLSPSKWTPGDDPTKLRRVSSRSVVKLQAARYNKAPCALLCPW